MWFCTLWKRHNPHLLNSSVHQFAPSQVLVETSRAEADVSVKREDA